MDKSRLIDYVDVKLLRTDRGLTQQMASEKMNRPLRYWRRIEKGEDGCTLHIMELCADALNCDLEIKFIPRENI